MSGERARSERAVASARDEPLAGIDEAEFLIVYDELLRIARRHLRRERTDHTLNTTALVHEAYLKLAGRPEARGGDRPWFLATASRAMRQILVDHARRRSTPKHGGGLHPVTLRTGDGADAEDTIELMALDRALVQLATRDPRLEQLVECRFFGGLTTEETAEVLSVSTRTVERDWIRARAYLAHLMNP